MYKQEMKNSNHFSLLCASVLVFLFSACQKTEFMPAPEGEQIAYEPEATDAVQTLLAKTPEASLFYQAWERSSMTNLLQEKGATTTYTLFVPNNAAMEAGGFTSAALAAMTTADIDSLMLFYTVLGQIRSETLSMQSLPLRSLLKQPGLYVQYFDNQASSISDPYYHKHYLALQDNQLLVNGKSKGNLNVQMATNGALYMMNATIERPTKTALEVLETDGRFSWFVEVMKKLDSNFAEPTMKVYRDEFYWDMTEEEFWGSYSYIRDRYNTIWQITPMPDPNYAYANIKVSTVFAPTDQAFKNAGFSSVEEIINFNIERGDARFDLNTFEPAGGFPLDTVLNYHKDWGRMFALRDPGQGTSATNPSVFFTNDLAAGYLDNYYVNIGGTADLVYAYRIPFVFSQANGQVQLKIRDAEQNPVSIVAGNINTLNGPIHAVDNLLLPKGFKLK